MTGLRLIRAGEVSTGTAQTSGMIRSAAISGPLTGSRLWMGTTALPPAGRGVRVRLGSRLTAARR